MRRLGAAQAFGLVLAVAAAPAAETVLQPFFAPDHVARTELFVGFECPAPPPVPTDVQSPAAEEPHQAHPDGDGDDEELDPGSIEVLNGFGNRVSDMADDSLRAVIGADLVGHCATRWLAHWADAGALAGLRSKQGLHLRKWELAAYAAAYSKVSQWATVEDAAMIEGWLQTLGHIVVHDFSTDTDLPSRRNNHLNWAIWGVANAAVVTGDADLWAWVQTRYAEVLEAVPADGFLPLELERGRSALGYHTYATAPLILTAEIFAQNGLDAYAIGNGALHRLVDVALAGLEDPGLFASRAGEEQDVDPILRNTRMSWLEVYNARFPSERAERWLSALRPLGHRTYGGSITRLFH